MTDRYRAVCEVLGGSPIGEVAARYGTSRQSLHTRRQRFQQDGMKGLADRSRRPRVSPNRVVAEVEALACELRRQYPAGALGVSATSWAGAESIRCRCGRGCTASSYATG